MGEPALSEAEAAGPAVVLVEPQLGENIGTAARAMANFGLTDLRIVNPRDGWPNDRAVAAASRADHILDRARIFDTVPEAIGDCGYVLATTARSRQVAKPVIGPQRAGEEMRLRARKGLRTAVLFGRERIGLNNEEVSLADAIVTLPVDPNYASLNVAQAVLIAAYEWRRSGLSDEEAGLPITPPDAVPASREELIHLFEHLENALDAAGYFRPAEKRPHMALALRAMLQRAGLTEQEVRSLRGAIAALEGRPTRPRIGSDGRVTTERQRPRR
jgi:tRNA/rRNA methyltransferase